jgi:two-component system, OmpR family, alkaline phosphatase synthesis response regulator PhoP
MSQPHILVVEDEEDILDLIKYNLQSAGYAVTGVDNGLKALKECRSLHPNLILLDLMLPGMDGLEVCRTLKAEPDTAEIPIVMLTAKGEEADIVTGLEMGADDYIVKPFSPRVVQARIKAILRRKKQSIPTEDESIRHGELLIHPGQHDVQCSGKKVDLTNTEFRILHQLARRPGWVFTRYQIVESTQTDNTDVTSRSVDVHIVALRRKLGDCGACIETIRGVGYRFKDPSDE